MVRRVINQGFARIQESDMFLRPIHHFSRPALDAGRPAGRRGAHHLRVLTRMAPRSKATRANALKRAVAHAEQLGFIYNTGPELEFFLFRENGHEAVPHDVGGYFDFSPGDEAQRVRSDITRALLALRIHVEMAHHEVAIGQHEIDFRYGQALHAADNAVTFKYTVKGIAAKHGLIATFMPTVFASRQRHAVHRSCDGSQNRRDQDVRPVRCVNLTVTARQFVAGHRHAAPWPAVVARRSTLQASDPGYERPCLCVWRSATSALIRVPRHSPGRENSTRVELRFPDPSCNPYLAFAVMLEAGLDGIERGLEPPPPVSDDVFHWTPAEREANGVGVLPGTLEEALDALPKMRLCSRRSAITSTNVTAPSA